MYPLGGGRGVTEQRWHDSDVPINKQWTISFNIVEVPYRQLYSIMVPINIIIISYYVKQKNMGYIIQVYKHSKNVFLGNHFY